MMVVAGAVGNIIDRIQFAAVVDFLLFYYKHWSYPIFNIADTWICMGVFGLLLPERLFKKHAFN